MQIQQPILTHKPEIMAPVGGHAQLQAAVRAGADAVYFGLDDGFNARIRANNLRRAELPDILHFLRDYGVKAYITLNTLVFDEELSRLEDIVLDLAEVGVDALIVQDWGLVSLARNIAPALPIHGSTQMSITDARGVHMAEAYGIERVVVGRELSIADIQQINAETNIELEAFVHGALCVSYSGQCFSSEAWGGRSANRGQCAQACRMPYDLIVDGKPLAEQDFSYVLSPQDLLGLSHLPQLIDAGVSCLKIEGRLKGPEYVYSTVTAYRQALDHIWSRREAIDHQQPFPVPVETRRNLAQVFSRGQSAQADGLTPGFFDGSKHQDLVIGRNPRHRGLFIGEIRSISQRGFTLDLCNPLKRGDGLVFDQGTPEYKEAGGNVYAIRYANQSISGEIDQGIVEIDMGRNFDLARIQIGDLVWRTKDAAKEAGFNPDQWPFARRVPITLEISGRIGQALQMRFSDLHHHTVEVLSEKKLLMADKSPLDETKLRKAIGQLGDTPFVIDAFRLQLDDDVFMPVGEIKAMRRRAVEQLISQRRQAPYQHIQATQAGLASHQADDAEPYQAEKNNFSPKLSLLCRTHEQVLAAIQLEQVGEIIVDFLEVHGLKEACAAVQASGKKLVVAAPRIFKPGEERLWLYYCRLQPDALLIRSAGLLWHFHALGGEGAYLQDQETPIPALYGDFSLNATNVIAVNEFLQLGLRRLTLGHDLNAQQIAQLAETLPQDAKGKIDVIAHHHLPIFHTEHCVFARFLSNGNSYKDCGRPCEKHQVHLRDHKGIEHLLQADIGCRNTLFNGEVQSAAPVMATFLDAGIQHFRIELVDEAAQDVALIMSSYQQLLSKEMTDKVVWQHLKRVTNANQHALGVGLGSLAVRQEMPRSAMKKPTAK